MSSPPTPPLDIVTVGIAIVSVFVGADAAQVVGPYTVIILSALGGAAWRATRKREVTLSATFLHMMLSFGMALLLTVPASEWLAYVSGYPVRWMLGPVAALIAARPDWVMAQVRGLWVDREGRKP